MNFSVESYLARTASRIDEAMASIVPRKVTGSERLFPHLAPSHRVHAAPLQAALADPIWNFLDRGGKRWRPALFLLVAEALGASEESLLELACIPELIHNGTLIIDDIEDASPLRRGSPSCHHLYGVDVALNAGNALYYLALMPLLDRKTDLGAEKSLRLHEIYLRIMTSLSMGQAMDIAWHRGLADADAIEESEYLQMCAWKTGALARLAAEMAAAVADASPEVERRFGDFAESIGVAFQLQDDILDLTEGEFTREKGGRGQDITEGKRSLPVIRALASLAPSPRARLLEILAAHSERECDRAEAIDLLESCGAIDHARGTARQLVSASWQRIEPFLPGGEGGAHFRAFALYLVERAK